MDYSTFVQIGYNPKHTLFILSLKTMIYCFCSYMEKLKFAILIHMLTIKVQASLWNIPFNLVNLWTIMNASLRQRVQQEIIEQAEL